MNAFASPDSAPFDSRSFRDALGTFPTGVAIITTATAQDGPSGITCNSFSSVSLDPPLVCWSLRKASSSLEAFSKSAAFAINILADGQNEMSSAFAVSRGDKFRGIEWRPGHGGAPVIEDCLASFECETFAVHDAGDHLLFLGRVRQFAHVPQRQPLVFHRGSYVMLTNSLKELVDRGGDVEVELNSARGRLYESLLQLACEAGTDSDFDAIASHLDELESYSSSDDIYVRMRSGLRFFRLIAQAAHNRVMLVVTDSLHTMLEHAIESQIKHARAHTPIVDLVSAEMLPVRRRLLALLRSRDSVGIQRVLPDYLTHATLPRRAGAAT